jgi:hypothetical protein
MLVRACHGGGVRGSDDDSALVGNGLGRDDMRIPRTRGRCRARPRRRRSPGSGKRFLSTPHECVEASRLGEALNRRGPVFLVHDGDRAGRASTRVTILVRLTAKGCADGGRSGRGRYRREIRGRARQHRASLFDHGLYRWLRIEVDAVDIFPELGLERVLDVAGRITRRVDVLLNARSFRCAAGAG